jgi:hypothetical protein
MILSFTEDNTGGGFGGAPPNILSKVDSFGNLAAREEVA